MLGYALVEHVSDYNQCHQNVMWHKVATLPSPGLPNASRLNLDAGLVTVPPKAAAMELRAKPECQSLASRPRSR